MELIDRRRKVYGFPASLVASEQEFDIRASYGPTPWQKMHVCSVRGVPVDKLVTQVEGISGYCWCRFPDGRIMVVFERNVKAVKIKEQFSHVQAKK
jgi:hypothetical protein